MELYDRLAVYYMMNYCAKCLRYSFENNRHYCDDKFTSVKIGKHEIYFETIDLCAECGGFEQQKEGVK